MGERVSQAEIARRLEVQPSSVSRFIGQRRWLRDTEGLIDWDEYVREHELSTARPAGDPKQRSLAAQADLRELELRQKRGELKPAWLVARAVEEAVAALLGAMTTDIDERFVQAGLPADHANTARSVVEALLHDARSDTAARMRELAATHDDAGGESG